MAEVIVKIGEMSVEEAKAWFHAIMDKYGSDLAMNCLKDRERRFEILAEKLPDVQAEIDEGKHDTFPSP